MEKLHDKKVIGLIAISMFLFFIVGWEFFQWHELHAKRININDYEVYANGDVFLCNIDNITLDDDGDISGWIIKKGESIKIVAIKVILQDTVTQKSYVVPTQVLVREDVTEFFDDGTNYDNSGFIVETKNLDYSLDIGNHDYQIFIYLDINGSECIVQTGLML